MARPSRTVDDMPPGLEFEFRMRVQVGAPLDQGDWVTDLKTADWALVSKQCATLLGKRSKDQRQFVADTPLVEIIEDMERGLMDRFLVALLGGEAVALRRLDLAEALQHQVAVRSRPSSPDT